MITSQLYVTTNLKRILNLASIKKRDISVQAFGKTDPRDTLDQVELCVISNDDKEIPINCFLQDICTPVTLQNLNLAKTNPHFNSIQLVNSNIDNKNLAIDILVGVNLYWDIVLKEFIKGKSGPAALNTKVGYVLSNPIENSHQDESNSVMLTHVIKV